MKKQAARPKRTALRSAASKHDVLRFAVVPTALGSVLVAGSAKGIAAILLAESPSRCVAELEELFPDAEYDEASPAEESAAAQVAAHVDDPSSPLKFPLDLRGTPFQVRVWNVVRKIPAGKTLTYGDVARKIGAPRAMRAVGSSCAKCRHLFAVPCHRVTASGDVAGDGAIRSGLLRGRLRPGADRRAALLRREIELLERNRNAPVRTKRPT
jgi:AraC family transcriptional regulator of adaptative response/methylated-DNA-[protein]-cysteine methyltransferase